GNRQSISFVDIAAQVGSQSCGRDAEMASRAKQTLVWSRKAGNGPAKQDPCMRLGIRTAISALVLTSIVVSAVGVHLLWWRTAHRVSQTLADTINEQIVSAVGDELQSITSEARSSMS